MKKNDQECPVTMFDEDGKSEVICIKNSYRQEMKNVRFFRHEPFDWNNERIPSDFVTRFSDLVVQWDPSPQMSLKDKCRRMLLNYIYGWGWRHHRTLCQLIYDDLLAVQDNPRNVYDFFQNQLKQYHFDINFDQNGLFMRTLLCCRYMIITEVTTPKGPKSHEGLCHIM